MTPPLSIVVPSHTRADLLALCLASVQAHAPAGTQVIVVDDGSPAGVVSRTAAGFGLTALRLPKAGGFCVAANRGIAAATADVVELLNDDAEVTPGWTGPALARFADPAVGAVSPLVLQNEPGRRGPPRIDTAGDEYHPGGYATKRGHGLPYRADGLYSCPREVWGVSASAGFYRREALLRTGCFPESFGAYFDDVDLACRLRGRGYVAWYEPASVVWHRVSASYGRRPSRGTLERQSRNEELLFWRNARRRHLPRHFGVLAAKACRRFGEGKLIPWSVGRVRAWFEVLTSV